MSSIVCRPTSLEWSRSHNVGFSMGTTSHAVEWTVSFPSEQTPVGRMVAPNVPEVLR